ncbi:MAG: hypothetical protein HW416_3270, partial [Chloroflexi bacterium]|nr:hypothetical protein [Chloroflexota bacterium]
MHVTRQLGLFAAMAFTLGIVALMLDAPRASAQETRPGTPQWS